MLKRKPFHKSTKQIQQSKSKDVPLPPCWHHGGEGYSSYSFLTSALDGGEWSASCQGCDLPPEEWSLGTHWIGGSGASAGLDTVARGNII
jgi:hypothetical protein